MAKKNKIKLPKRLAGVKISKKIRKGPLGEFLTSQTGQQLLAEALVLAGGAFLGKKAVEDTPAGEAIRHPVKSAKQAGRKTVKAGKETKGVVGDATARLSFAFAEAARTFRESLQDPAPEWPGIAEGVALEGTPEPLKKEKPAAAPAASTVPH